MTSEELADRTAVADVVLRYFEFVDTKDWDRMHEVFTDDTTARWTPSTLMVGIDNVVGASRHMVGGDEVVTFHHVASMTPVVHGDTAEVKVRVRAMHYGLGPRAGKFYESLAVQPTELVRTAAGWRISHHEWMIVATFGSMEDLFAPELGAGRALMSFHPRLALNSISSLMQSLDDDLALWADLGVTNVGLISPKLDAPGWDAARDAVLGAGLVVSSMSCYPEELVPSIEFTAAVDSHVLYLPTGPGESYRWDDAAARYCEEMEPLVARAKELDIVLAIEPTNPLRSDMSFVFTVRDAVDLARMAGTGVCVDFYSAWYERGLDEVVRKNIDLIALVQVCDFKIGTFDTPNRAAVGDGDVPVERLLALLLDAGYEGVFELEILGPAIEAEGYRGPIVRSLEHMSEMLDRLGA